jgi:hypothetical protein
MEKFRQERSSIAEEVAELCLDVQTFLSDVQLERQQKAAKIYFFYAVS